jgi:hypothetical protein
VDFAWVLTAVVVVVAESVVVVLADIGVWVASSDIVLLVAEIATVVSGTAVLACVVIVGESRPGRAWKCPHPVRPGKCF